MLSRKNTGSKRMEIQEYTHYDAAQILSLYGSVGWIAYTEHPETLRAGFENSLLVLAAYEGETLIGLLRAVGDGQTVVLLQDILVLPAYQRRGVGTALVREALQRFKAVRQVHLVTDDRPETAAFYASLGFRPLQSLGCKGYMRG